MATARAAKAGQATAGAAALHVALTVAAMRHAVTPGAGSGDLSARRSQLRAPAARGAPAGRRVALVSIDGSCAGSGRSRQSPAPATSTSSGCTRWSAGSSGGVAGGRPGRTRTARPHRRTAPGEPARAHQERHLGARLRLHRPRTADYFFHINALEPGLEFEQLEPDLTVSFEVKSGPARAAPARRVSSAARAGERGEARAGG